MDIIWTNFAIEQLKHVYVYYKVTASFSVANNIKKSILKACKVIAKYPAAGMVEENLAELNADYRYIVEGNHKIIYRLTNKTIYIIDLFDCRQNPQKIKK